MSDYLDIQLMDSLETRKAHPVYTESASCLLIILYANLLVCISLSFGTYYFCTRFIP